MDNDARVVVLGDPGFAQVHRVNGWPVWNVLYSAEAVGDCSWVHLSEYHYGDPDEMTVDFDRAWADCGGDVQPEQLPPSPHSKPGRRRRGDTLHPSPPLGSRWMPLDRLDPCRQLYDVTDCDSWLIPRCRSTGPTDLWWRGDYDREAVFARLRPDRAVDCGGAPA